MLTCTVPGLPVPLIQAIKAPVPTGAVLTAAIQGGDGSGGLTWVGVPHPLAVWTAAVIWLAVPSYQPAKSFAPLAAMPRSTGLAPGKTGAAGVVQVPPGGRLLASAPPTAHSNCAVPVPSTASAGLAAYPIGNTVAGAHVPVACWALALA